MTLHRITAAHGLLTMLRSRDAGDIVLDRPQLTLHLPEPAPAPSDPVPGEPPPGPDPDPPPDPVEAEDFTWPPWISRLICRNGTLMIRHGQRLLAIGDLDFDIERKPDPLEVLTLLLTGRQLDASGTIRIDLRLSHGKTADVMGTPIPPGVLAVQVSQWDLAPLGHVMRAMEPLAGAGGTMTAAIEFGWTDEAEAWDVKIESETESLVIPLPDGNLLQEDRVTLAARARIGESGEISFAPFSFDTSALGLTASGKLDRIDARMHLECDGMLRYDLDGLTRRAAEWQMELPVTVSGSAERPFTIHMPLDAGWMQEGVASVSVAMEHLEGYGLRADSLEIPLTLRNGVASAIIATGIDEGEIDLRPRLQSTDERLILTLPADATVLRNIPLTDELAEELLAKIHPAFSGAVVASGTVDLTFDEFYLPLAADTGHEIIFRGTLQLRDVILETADLLDRVRELARIREAAYRIGDHDIRFACADGRVETSPLQLRIEGHPVTISGSMGLDGTLDYAVRTPVTERLVGRDVYNLLKDTTLNIPVRGTVSRPQLGEKEVREAVADLIRQAGRRAIERGAQDLLRQLLE